MPYFGTQPPETALTTGDLADDIVTEAKMANDAIGLAELKAGTDGELITWDASGNPAVVGAGTSGHYLKSQGAGSVPVFAEVSAGFTVHSDGTKSVSSSSDTYTWTSIPSTVKLIIINYFLIDLNANDQPYVQIGDSGGLETSGYVSASANHNGGIDETVGFNMGSNESSASYSGMMFLSLAEDLGDSSTNTWVCSGTNRGLSEKPCHYGGYKPLSATLDRVQFMCDSGDAFDNSTGRLLLMYM